VLSHQLIPQKGEVLFGEKSLHTISIASLARIRAVLSQNIEMAFPLKVYEVVMMGRYPHFTGKPSQKDELAAIDAMRFFDVYDMMERDYITLSGGEKQRVHFARVVAQIWYPVKDHCRYLILDEPLTFLDVHYQFNFMHKLIELLENKDMVIAGVVHDLNLAAKFAGQIILLHQGKVLAGGSREEVLTKAHIKTAYHLEPMIHRENKSMYLFFE
jgi:iron complex transport system ATP-binding protein